MSLTVLDCACWFPVKGATLWETLYENEGVAARGGKPGTSGGFTPELGFIPCIKYNNYK